MAPLRSRCHGAVAEWLRSGLQSRLHRFDSGRRLALEAGQQARDGGLSCTTAASLPSAAPATIPARTTKEEGQMAVADAKGRKFDAATGIGFAVVAVVGLALPGTPPKASDSTTKIISFFADHRGDILAARFVFALAAVLFLWFLGSLRSYLRAGEGGEGRLSAAAFGGGVAGIVLLLTGVAVLNGIAFELARTPGADPNVTRAVFDA